ncbi:MAG: hypothetical protein P8L18_00220 [Verrucomicrobiota bacterium]|jgi:hypothetical protein|nr:hypothetical protein [Verrucomicrobiota bacterium]
MIQLNPDCVMVELENGQALPHSVELVTVEFLGDAASWMDPECLRSICEGVVIYLRDELGKGVVPLHEFARVLGAVMRDLGFDANLPLQPDNLGRVYKTDIGDWLGRHDLGFDLMLFKRLREEMCRRLDGEAPSVLWIHGIRKCVKRHLGARRWSQRCQLLNDQLVAFIRACFDREADKGSALVLHAR